ncbi:LysE family translocator [Eionea flava]
MSEYLFLLPIAAALLLGAMSPGPSFILVSQVAMSQSRAAAITTSLGMATGAATFGLLASAGLYIILESVPMVYTALKIVGGLYLCFLAYKIWITAKQPLVIKVASTQHTGKQPTHAQQITTKDRLRLLTIGLLTQLSNPKTAIVFASIFVAFLPEQLPNYAYILLIMVAFLMDFSWYLVVSLVLSTHTAQQGYAKYKCYFDRAASSFMGLMGIKLLYNH